MTDEEIAAYRKRLNELTNQRSDDKPEQKLQPELAKLAREVGASTCVFYVHTVSGPRTGTADTSQLICNIHQALQTASMVNMCRTATQGYEMAAEASRSASKQFRIAATIACLSALAACASAVVALVAVVWK